jgi:hypothetical protein
MSNAGLANYRKARAVELALAGASYEAIAHELGLANRGTAWRYGSCSSASSAPAWAPSKPTPYRNVG